MSGSLGVEVIRVHPIGAVLFEVMGGVVDLPEDAVADEECGIGEEQLVVDAVEARKGQQTETQ